MCQVESNIGFGIPAWVQLMRLLHINSTDSKRHPTTFECSDRGTQLSKLDGKNVVTS